MKQIYRHDHAVTYVILRLRDEIMNNFFKTPIEIIIKTILEWHLEYLESLGYKVKR